MSFTQRQWDVDVALANATVPSMSVMIGVMTSGHPSNIAIYCRISKDDGRALGVERQERECRQLADRLGWKVGDVLVDNDISAFTGKRRPAYEKLIAGLGDGTFDGLVVWATDRLYRRTKDLSALIDLIGGEQMAVPVATVAAGQVDLTTAAGRLNAKNLANFAEFESEQKSERIKAQRRQLAAAGGYNGGARPYGFEADGVTHRADEAAVLRRAVEDLLDGKSLNSVAARVGLHRSSLRRLLLAPRIAGLRVFHGEVVGDAAWAPIIPRATWEQLKATMSDPRRKTTRPSRGYLLTGFVYAVDERGDVVAKMISRPDNGTRRYLALRPKSRSITAEPLEQFVVEAILRHFDSTVVPTSQDAAGDDAAAKVIAIEAEVAELSRLRGADEISMEAWLVALKGTNERLEAARRALPVRRSPKADEALFAVPGALRAAWDEAESFARRREIVVAALTAWGKVVGVGPGSRGSWFDTTRIHLVDR